MSQTTKARRFPPGPSSSIPGYLYFSLRRDPLGFLMRAVREHGDIVHVQIGPRHDYLLNHPDYIKEVMLAPEGIIRSAARPLRRVLGQGLLTSQGEPHHRRRRLMQPVLHVQQVAAWARVIVERAARVRDAWKPDMTIDVAPEMSRLALGIIIELLLNRDIDRMDENLTRPLWIVCKAVNQNTFPSLSEMLVTLPLPRVRRLQRAVADVDSLLYRAMDERRQADSENGDVLSMLLALRDSSNEGKGLSDEQIRDEVLTLILAGHETIGTALTWTWYLLSNHPAVEQAMHAEVDTVLNGRLPTSEDLGKLVYVRRVFSESLRLYPPVWVFPRRPTRDYQLGGYEVPAGSYFQLCPYVTQRDARFFPDPERFDPERWTPEAIASRPKFSFFSFAAGAHRCIGENLAWTEGVLALATIAQKWRLRLAPGHPVEADPLITLRPKFGMRMIVERRK